MYDNTLKSMGMAAIVVLFIPFMAFLGAFVGYFAGWVFGLVFSDTWQEIHSWLQMPPQLTCGMFGAFLGMFGGYFGKAVSKS